MYKEHNWKVLEHNGKVLVEKTNTFDLKQISQSGQCFRLKQISENEFIAITQNHYIVISLTEKGYEFNCSMLDFEEIRSKLQVFREQNNALLNNMQDSRETKPKTNSLENVEKIRAMYNIHIFTLKSRLDKFAKK